MFEAYLDSVCAVDIIDDRVYVAQLYSTKIVKKLQKGLIKEMANIISLNTFLVKSQSQKVNNIEMPSNVAKKNLGLFNNFPIFSSHNIS